MIYNHYSYINFKKECWEGTKKKMFTPQINTSKSRYHSSAICFELVLFIRQRRDGAPGFRCYFVPTDQHLR